MERLKSPARWTKIAYLVVMFPVGCVTFAVAAGVISGGLALLALPAYVPALPQDRASLGLFDVSGIGTLPVPSTGFSVSYESSSA